MGPRAPKDELALAGRRNLNKRERYVNAVEFVVMEH